MGGMILLAGEWIIAIVIAFYLLMILWAILVGGLVALVGDSNGSIKVDSKMRENFGEKEIPLPPLGDNEEYYWSMWSDKPKVRTIK